MILDTGVLIGVLNPLDVHHSVATDTLHNARRSGDSIVLPTLVIAELLVGAYRLGPDSVRIAEDFTDSVADRVIDIGLRIARTAARLRAVHPKLRMPDALVIATGLVEVVTRIVTTDAAWAGVDARVELLVAAP